MVSFSTLSSAKGGDGVIILGLSNLKHWALFGMGLLCGAMWFSLLGLQPAYNNDHSPASISPPLRESSHRITTTASHLSRDNDSDYASTKHDVCNVDYWKSELAATTQSEDLLGDVTESDLGFIHITFSVNGTQNRKANDLLTGLHNRSAETNHSVACLQRTLPNVAYTEIRLGDFASYQQALEAQHQWLSSNQGPYETTFLIDTDVYANPHSAINAMHLVRALRNVDLALVYSPNRGRVRQDRFNLQEGGVQAGLMGQRSHNNKRVQLFHACVAQTLRQTNHSIRQQYAMNKVLESPLGQFVRVKWLPPEFHCWSPHLNTMEDFVVNTGPHVHNDSCYFVHSHNLAKKGGLGVCHS